VWTYKNFVVKLEVMSRRRWEDNTKMDYRDAGEENWD
jgi:hypothetical protein